MGTLVKNLFCGLLLLAVCTPILAQDFTVENYDVDVYLKKEGYFEVVENYDIDFKRNKHGIFRDIQTSYDLLTENGDIEKRRIRISDVEVPGHMFTASGGFGQKIQGYATVKIGDPDKTVFGPVHYEIRYRVDNALLFETEYTRLYWNLKPTDWYPSFREMDFRIHLPEQMNISPDEVYLYSGSIGVTSESEEFELDIRDGLITGTSKESFVSHYGQAVTILVNFPPGTIEEIKPLWPFFNKHGWILILGLLSTIFYLVFRKYGKDDPAPAVITYFPPDNLDPAMAGFLINDKENTSDIISLIPYWGWKGLLKMEEIDKKSWFSRDDIRITKTGELPSGSPLYQRIIFNGLFSSGSEVLLSSLRNSFYSKMNRAKTKLKKSAQQYYDPKARRVFHLMIGSIIVIHLLLIPVMIYFWGFLAGILTFVSMIVLLILNRFMIKKNRLGTKLYSELKGFKQFIKTAETGKLKMLINETPLYFESTMAYALAFRAFDKWAKKFNDLNVPPPKWYDSHTGNFNSINDFSSSFSSSMSSARSTMVSSPSSSGSSGGGFSGGGSSGGGFGGGGGGSW